LITELVQYFLRSKCFFASSKAKIGPIKIKK
jgi:hypothetical protein